MTQPTTSTPAPAPPPALVTLTIDGRSVSVPKGTSVLEAARTLGIDVPAFCYHPGLSIAACCRQCLVKVEKAPKLQPSCQQTVAEGMVVNTQDPVAVDMRRQMLEFTLVNHPIDCPICDKAGECTLQKLYVDHDAEHSRVDVPKVRKPKVVDVGPHILLDQERCILCTRCVRVCDEVAHDSQLTMANRGDREVLTTAPGQALDNPYSINTVDVCPVGALTAKDFRFTLRAWELLTTPSICNGCATGCNVEVHHRESRVWRLVPRHNPDVNKYWMCDEGRFTYKELRDERLLAPLIDGLPATWDRALAAAAAKLEGVLASDRGSVGVVLSPRHANEANFLLARLARDVWQAGRLYVGGKPPAPERADDVLRDADVNANGRGVAAILAGSQAGGPDDLAADLAAGKLRGLVVLGHELPIGDAALAAAAKLAALVVVSEREVGIAAKAQVALPCAAWTEAHGTITNRQGRVQRMRAAYPPGGQALPAWEAVVKLGRATGAALAHPHAKAVFQEMVTQVEAFTGAEWGREAPLVQLRFAGSRG